jgi:PAS domain S-box-containing protein
MDHVTSAAVLDTALNASAQQEVVLLLEPSGRITLWSSRAAAVFGSPEEHAVGKLLHELLDTGSTTALEKTLGRYRTGSGTEDPPRHTMLRSQGGVELLASFTPLTGAGQELLLCTLIPATTPRMADVSERRLHMLADHIDQLVWTASVDGSSWWFNKRWIDFTQMAPEEITARAATEIHHPDHYPRVVETLTEAGRKEMPWEAIFPMRRHDGVWRWFLSRAIPIRNASGQVDQWFGSNTDITEQLRIQEELKASEQRFHALAHTIPQLVNTYDVEQGHYWFNARWKEFTGLTGGEIIADPMRVHHPDQLDRMRKAARHARERGEQWQEYLQLKRADGAYRWFLARSVPVKNDAGRITTWFTTCTDIHEQREAEDRVRESETRLRATFEQTAVGIAQTDTSGRFLFVNRQLASMCGYDMDEMLELHMQEITHPDDLANNLELFHTAIRDGQPFDIEKRYLRKHGEPLWVHVSVSPIMNLEGSIDRVFAVIVDITDRKRTAQELKASLREVQDLKAAMDEHAIVAVTDPKGRITAVNDKFCKISGYERAELLGKDHRIVNSGKHPKEFFGNLWSTISSGHIWKGEILNKAKDGRLYWVDTTIVPFLNDLGRPQQYIAIRNDITERKQAEQLIRESEERFRSMANNAPVLIWLSDPSHARIWMNTPWLDLVGRTLEEESGDGWLENVHPDDRAYCLATYAKAFKEHVAFTLDYRLRRKDGEYRWFFDHGTPRYDTAGNFLGFIGSCIDVTERRLAQELLENAGRQKDQFLATLAHELRNPLAPLRNGLHVLDLAERDMELTRQMRIMMDRQLDHLVRLVDDLMDLSRISRGQIELRREPVDLLTVASMAVEAVRPHISTKQQQLVVDLPAEPVVVYGDPTRLTQIVGNLLSNANRYTTMHGHITVRVQTVNGLARITVRDNGIGMEPDSIARAFDMFTQLEGSNGDSSGGGLGIGLNIVKRLVEMHDGVVQGHSEGKGLGSEFMVLLPVYHKGMGTQADHDRHLQQEAPQKILIVDDNRDAASSLFLLLQKRGHNVRLGHDGEQALTLAGEFKPELIIMDLGMPNVNGYDACQEIRRREWGRTMRIVALSGWGQKNDIRRSREAGFDAHFIKPLSEKQLTGILLGTDHGIAP